MTGQIDMRTSAARIETILRPVLWMLALVVAVISLGRGDLDAQEAEIRVPGTLSGFILDAQTGKPLVGAIVALEPIELGLLGDGRGGPFPRHTRSVLTDRNGAYRFIGLPQGQYRVYVRRLGYGVRWMEVDLRRSAHSTVSLGLEIDPIALHPVRISRPIENPFSASQSAYANPRPEWAGATPGRPGHRMMPDVQNVNHELIAEAVTLGETDVFRALQRSAGISARDDYTAVLWTRGAEWDHTRVYFDGLPLYNPTHAGWLVSSINPDAIGAAFMYPGVRDASLGEGAAGVLDLKSRVGGIDEAFGGAAELSVVSGRIALDGPLPAGQGGWMIAARRSHIDLATNVLDALSDGGYSHLPFAFADVVGRLDLRFSDDWGVTASGIWEQDFLEGDLPGVIQGNTARWGNRGGRVTIDGALSNLRMRHTVGATMFEAFIEERTDEPVVAPVFREKPTDNWVHYGTVQTEISPRTADGTSPAWSLGIGVVGQTVSYSGPVYAAPRGGVFVDEEGGEPPVVPEVMHSRRVEMDDALWHATLWGERRWYLGDRAAIQTGLRLEGGPAVVNGGVVRPAPRISARYALDPELSLSAAWNRSYQYTQAIVAAGKSVGPDQHLSYLWGLAGEEVPMIESDIFTVGVERWFGPEWRASATGYLREATGMAVPDPSVGSLESQPLFVEARNSAYGAEVGIRRLAGSWTGSLSYSTGSSELRTEGYRFPAPTDRRHSLDATAALSLAPELKIGGAFTAASGTPYTRVLLNEPTQIGLPGAHRGPTYFSVDLTSEWTTRLWGADITGFMQLRNALGLENAVTYRGSTAECGDDPVPESIASCVELTSVHDEFLSGLPRLPLLGVRVVF